MADKRAVAVTQKSSSTSKNHADPPPSRVTEPEEDGEEYIIGGFLGKGGFAVCYEGTLARNGRVFAMKVVKSQMPQKKMEEKVQLDYPGRRVGALALTLNSFAQSSKFTQKCVTLSSFNSTAPSPSTKAHTLSSNYAQMDRSWIWSESDVVSAYQKSVAS